MRSLILSLASFTSVIAGFIFFISDGSDAVRSKIVQPNIPVQQVSLVAAAQKNEKEIKYPSEPMEKLTKGEWKIQSITSNKPCDTNYDGVATTNVTSEMPACALDDVVKFHPDGIVAFQRFERCELTEEDIEKYNWFYSSKNGQLNIARGSVDAIMILRTVSENQFVVDIPMQDGGESHLFTVTYGRPAKVYP